MSISDATGVYELDKNIPIGSNASAAAASSTKIDKNWSNDTLSENTTNPINSHTLRDDITHTTKDTHTTTDSHTPKQSPKSKFEKMKFLNARDTISAHEKHSIPTVKSLFPVEVEGEKITMSHDAIRDRTQTDLPKQDPNDYSDQDLVLRKTVSFQEKVVVNSYDDFQERVKELRKRKDEEIKNMSMWKRWSFKLGKMMGK